MTSLLIQGSLHKFGRRKDSSILWHPGDKLEIQVNILFQLWMMKEEEWKCFRLSVIQITFWSCIVLFICHHPPAHQQCIKQLHKKNWKMRQKSLYYIQIINQKGFSTQTRLANLINPAPQWILWWPMCRTKQQWRPKKLIGSGLLAAKWTPDKMFFHILSCKV